MVKFVPESSGICIKSGVANMTKYALSAIPRLETPYRVQPLFLKVLQQLPEVDKEKRVFTYEEVKAKRFFETQQNVFQNPKRFQPLGPPPT